MTPRSKESNNESEFVYKGAAVLVEDIYLTMYWLIYCRMILGTAVETSVWLPDGLVQLVQLD